MAVKESEPQPSEELIVTRVFDAPRELVFKAWTEPERMIHWWGPKGYKMVVGKMDLRPGGIFHYGLQSPAGQMMWGKFAFREIVVPEKMVFVVSFSDENTGTTRHPLSATWPLEVMNILTLSEAVSKTSLTIKGYPINATEEERITFNAAHSNVQQGFKGTMDQLDEYLSKETKG